MEAFVIRMHSARLAGRSLDVQTYIWHADDTGAFLARQILEAADRGVKVRLLVDDLDARARNTGFAALAAHPNIDVRLFNPFASRKGGLQLASEGARDFKRINRRMHNKSWIAERNRPAHEALQQAITSGTVDEGTIRARSAEVAQGDADMAILQARIYAEAVRVLTPDQQTQLKKLQAEMKDHGPGRGRGPRPPQ